jgi:hypothetical protein
MFELNKQYTYFYEYKKILHLVPIYKLYTYINILSLQSLSNILANKDLIVM